MTNRDILGLNSRLDDTLSDSESENSISLNTLNLDSDVSLKQMKIKKTILSSKLFSVLSVTELKPFRRLLKFIQSIKFDHN
jgi:hypothetical protein